MHSNLNKEIYTSYYALSGEDPRAIGTSIIAPPFFAGPILNIVAPTWDMVTGAKQSEQQYQASGQYEHDYIELLHSRQLTAEYVYSLLPEQAILLCFEKDETYCHRRMLARWLETNLNITIPELQHTFVEQALDFE